jgi:hypothetical protein
VSLDDSWEIQAVPVILFFLFLGKRNPASISAVEQHRLAVSLLSSAESSFHQPFAFKLQSFVLFMPFSSQIQYLAERFARTWSSANAASPMVSLENHFEIGESSIFTSFRKSSRVLVLINCGSYSVFKKLLAE